MRFCTPLVNAPSVAMAALKVPPSELASVNCVPPCAWLTVPVTVAVAPGISGSQVLETYERAMV